MKNTIFAITVTALMAAATFSACQSPAEKEKAAQDKVQDAKKDLKEAKADANAEEQKVASAEEWKTFKYETDVKIRNNDARIAELKVRINRPGKVLDPLYAKQINGLEKRNAELRMRMDAYEKSQSDWASFKREYNHDMDELAQSLKDFTVDNKK
jgi:hypothetical protein